MIRLQSTAWPESAASLDLARLAEEAAASLADIETRLAFAARSAELVGPLAERTAGRNFAGLAAAAAVEVTLARVIEPHLDALSIIGQAGRTPSDLAQDLAHHPTQQSGERQATDHATTPGTRQDALDDDALRRSAPNDEVQNDEVLNDEVLNDDVLSRSAMDHAATDHAAPSQAATDQAAPSPAAPNHAAPNHATPTTTTWGVFAAEAPGLTLRATQHDGGWRLTGTKPWCSLASRLSHALVTATTGPGERRLFAVDLRIDGVTTDDSAWLARGLPLVASAPVTFDAVPAVPVGEDGWYLRRSGFAWGGIGVAACWWGGAIPLVDRLLQAARAKPDAELLLRALGAASIDLAIAEQAIAEAGRAIEQGDADGVAGARLAQRVRSTVRGRVDAIRAAVLAALGPAPLTNDRDYLSRMSDLELYVQQDHGDRDLARYGRLLVEAD